MSHKHKVKIQKLFEHPTSGDIDSKKLFSALEHYGCSIEMTKHGKVKITKNDEECIISLSHRNELSKDVISRLRHYLEKIGLTPDTIE